jgi:hypothetical protein
LKSAPGFSDNGRETRLTTPPSTVAADRMRALAAQGRELLEAGRFREAALVFERVLAHGPADEDARHGLERARTLAAEAQRRFEEQLNEGDAALLRGERDLARRTFEDLLEEGAFPDVVVARLEKLDERGGLVTLGAARGGEGDDDARAAGAGPLLSRRAFATFWCLLVLALGGGVAFSWEPLLSSLVEAPAPSARQPASASRLPEPTPGERALREARERVEHGELAEALRVLDAIGPQDAAYPFARQLRESLAATRMVSR